MPIRTSDYPLRADSQGVDARVEGVPEGAISLQIKYAIRHLAGSPVKWFGLAPYNPLIEIQPLFLATERPPRLKRV